MIEQEGAIANESTYTNALGKAKQAPKSAAPYTKPTFGYVAQWLSELGRPELDGLLKYADEQLNPVRENGGLFYERNDQPYDEGRLRLRVKLDLHADSEQIYSGNTWIHSRGMLPLDMHV